MLNDEHIKIQRVEICKYLESKHRINLDDLKFYDDYTSTLLRSIISLKLWSDMLERKKAVPNGSLQYLVETVSNINQTLLMGILGFKSPSYSMIRRSLENIISFFYYKDHPIELVKKQTDQNFKNLSVKDMGDYIKNYPYNYYYQFKDEKQIEDFISKVMGLWKVEYQELSKFVHGSTEKYLDLSNYLDEIIPNNDTIIKIEKHISKFSSIVNVLNLLFFFKLYKDEFSEEEKQFIRRSIRQEGYKKNIQEIFGEI